MSIKLKNINLDNQQFLEHYNKKVETHLTADEIHQYKQALTTDVDTAKRLIKKAYRRRDTLSLNKRNRQAIKEAKNKPCTDCGVLLPSHIMTFDHLGNKEFAISSFTSHAVSRGKMNVEIAKCVVCPQCHFNRELKRGTTKLRRDYETTALSIPQIREMREYLRTQHRKSNSRLKPIKARGEFPLPSSRAFP
jgi:hypothetical protein